MKTKKLFTIGLYQFYLDNIFEWQLEYGSNFICGLTHTFNTKKIGWLRVRKFVKLEYMKGW